VAFCFVGKTKALGIERQVELKDGSNWICDEEDRDEDVAIFIPQSSCNLKIPSTTLHGFFIKNTRLTWILGT